MLRTPGPDPGLTPGAGLWRCALGRTVNQCGAGNARRLERPVESV